MRSYAVGQHIEPLPARESLRVASGLPARDAARSPGYASAAGAGSGDASTPLVERAARTPPRVRSPSPTATPVAASAAPPHRAVPCLVLFSAQGPRPLDGLVTTTLSRPGAAAAAPRRGPLQARGASVERPLTSAAGRRTAKDAAVSGAARSSPSGVRCVYDRDTRSQLLHIAPGTEVDFAACVRRLPPLAALPNSTAAGAATTAALLPPPHAVHTIIAVQLCLAAPASPPPPSLVSPPSNFHVELVVRTGSSSPSSGAARRQGTSSGYRLRFTNAVSDVQRHAHHARIPLHCVRTAQWVQMFVDVETLLRACQSAGGVIAGGGPWRLHQIHIGVGGGGGAGADGLYVRRIIAGHGLALPHPAVDHLVTVGGAPATADGWPVPEALRLPVEAGESLCVFARTGKEYVLTATPLLPPAPALQHGSGGDLRLGHAAAVAEDAARVLPPRRRTAEAVAGVRDSSVSASSRPPTPPAAPHEALPHREEEEEAAAAAPSTSKAQRRTALEQLRRREPDTQRRRVAPTAHPPLSALPVERVRDDDSSSTTAAAAAAAAGEGDEGDEDEDEDEAAMFIVREVSAAEQLAAAAAPQYPANQLMTGRPPLRHQSPPLSAAAEVAAVRQTSTTDAAAATSGGAGATARSPASCAPHLLRSPPSPTTSISTETADASDVSVVSHSSAFALMEEMAGRVRRIHAVLAEAEEEDAATAAAAAVAAVAAASQPRRWTSPARTAAPPLAGRREHLTRNGGGALVAEAIARLSPPPPLPSSASPVGTAVKLTEAAVGSMPRGPRATAGLAACSPPPAPQAPPPPSPPRRAASATPEDGNAVLELWSSAEVPLLQLPVLERPPAHATAVGLRTPLAERLRAHQAAPSSSSLPSSPSAAPTADASAGAVSPPTSAVTSWTFHSAAVTPQTPFTVHRVLPAETAAGATAEAGAALQRASGPPPSATAATALATAAVSARSRVPVVEAVGPTVLSSGRGARAVVWRRPVPVPVVPRTTSDATRRALLDDVRVADTPPSPPPPPLAATRAVVHGDDNGSSRRVVAWADRPHTAEDSLGLHTPLLQAGEGAAGVGDGPAAAQLHVYPLAAAPPQPPGVCHSMSTVGSFHMWCPSSFSSAPRVSSSRGRYPSATTPSSGGGAGGAGGDGEALLLGTPAVAVGSVSEAQPPPAPAAQPPRLSIAATPLSARPPLPPPPLPGGPAAEVGRYVFDGVLQCYLDLKTNAYVEAA
ncbi:hypothetical protein NESM_000433300 [Novymonas esmeraldas]|uniref:CFA20 domain-containing protein n=1 Tax=Novymonas esmeraldas TaxID=1808958 RepID=A0AAW0ELV2_9TRYP